MLKNEQGSFLIDALSALLLAMIMLVLLISACKGWYRAEEVKEQTDIYELFEAGTRIYDD